MKEIILTGNAPAPIGPYSQAVKIGSLVFISGQLGIDPATGNLEATVEAQAYQIMKNIGAILKQCGGSFDSMIKTTIFLTNLQDFAKVNEIYQAYFSNSFPARSTIEVAKLPKNASVEIEAIAALP
jgi:2-iminobutanoate/2-iminopropanoate deaminase